MDTGKLHYHRGEWRLRKYHRTRTCRCYMRHSWGNCTLLGCCEEAEEAEEAATGEEGEEARIPSHCKGDNTRTRSPQCRNNRACHTRSPCSSEAGKDRGCTSGRGLPCCCDTSQLRLCS